MEKLKNYYDLIEDEDRKVLVDYINNNTIIINEGNIDELGNKDYLVGELNHSRNITVYLSKKNRTLIYALMRMVFDDYDEAVEYGESVLQSGCCVEISKSGSVEEI